MAIAGLGLSCIRPEEERAANGNTGNSQNTAEPLFRDGWRFDGTSIGRPSARMKTGRWVADLSGRLPARQNLNRPVASQNDQPLLKKQCKILESATGVPPCVPVVAHVRDTFSPVCRNPYQRGRASP